MRRFELMSNRIIGRIENFVDLQLTPLPLSSYAFYSADANYSERDRNFNTL